MNQKSEFVCAARQIGLTRDVMGWLFPKQPTDAHHRVISKSDDRDGLTWFLAQAQRLNVSTAPVWLTLGAIALPFLAFGVGVLTFGYEEGTVAFSEFGTIVVRLYILTTSVFLVTSLCAFKVIFAQARANAWVALLDKQIAYLDSQYGDPDSISRKQTHFSSEPDDSITVATARRPRGWPGLSVTLTLHRNE